MSTTVADTAPAARALNPKKPLFPPRSSPVRQAMKRGEKARSTATSLATSEEPIARRWPVRGSAVDSWDPRGGAAPCSQERAFGGANLLGFRESSGSRAGRRVPGSVKDRPSLFGGAYRMKSSTRLRLGSSLALDYSSLVPRSPDPPRRRGRYPPGGRRRRLSDRDLLRTRAAPP